MIKASGNYYISKDDGITWLKSENLLVTGYYNENLDGGSYLAVGDDESAVNYNDSTIPNLASSDFKAGFSGNIVTSVTDSSFSVVRTQDYDFGLGNNFSISEIGLVTAGHLVSRSLFKDGQGNPLLIPITGEDTLKARYQLEYTFPRASMRAEVNYNGSIIGADVFFVNPNKWTGSAIGEPMVCSSVGVGSSWVIGEDAYLTGSAVISSLTDVTTGKSNAADKKVYTCGFFSSLNELVGTFDQIIFCNGTASPGNAIVMIHLDNPIEKTLNDVFSMSASFIQEPDNGNP